jgi:hypothetical protein
MAAVPRAAAPRTRTGRSPTASTAAPLGNNTTVYPNVSVVMATPTSVREMPKASGRNVVAAKRL